MFADVRHHRRDALHVAPDHHEGHAGRRRRLLDVVVRPLRLVAERQRVVQEHVGGIPTDLDEARHGHLRQRRTHRVLRQQIPADQADIRLADLDERLARAVMRRPDDVQALIGAAAAKKRDMEHGDSLSQVRRVP